MLDDEKIISDYGKALQNLPPNEVLFPESLLPYSKQKIKKALVREFKNTRNGNLLTGLIFLKDFIPDAELPNDPLERIMLFAELNKKDK